MKPLFFFVFFGFLALGFASLPRLVASLKDLTALEAAPVLESCLPEQPAPSSSFALLCT